MRIFNGAYFPSPGMTGPAMSGASFFTPSTLCSASNGDEFMGGGGGSWPVDPTPKAVSARAVSPQGVFSNTGVDFDRYPQIYPFVPGAGVRTTIVRHRKELRVSDIPQLKDVFERARRDDFLVMHFVDYMFGEVINRGEDFENLSQGDVELLAGKIDEIGVDVFDDYRLRRFITDVLVFSGLRYPKRDDPSDTILPLIACIRSGMLRLDPRLRAVVRNSIEEDNRDPQAIYRKIEDAVLDIAALDQRARGQGVKSLLTNEQMKSLSREMSLIARIFYEESPVFVERNDSLPALLVLKEDLKPNLPKGFIDSPSRYIESKTSIRGGSEFEPSKQYYDLNLQPANFGRLRRFKIGNVNVISKRVESYRVRMIEEEIVRAEAFSQAIEREGVGGCRTCEYLGIVYDRGNFYLLMRDEGVRSIYDTDSHEGRSAFDSISEDISRFHPDWEYTNALWKGDDGLVVIDFEQHAHAIRAHNFKPDQRVFEDARFSRISTLKGFRALGVEGASGDASIYSRFEAALRWPVWLAGGLDAAPTNVAIGDIHGNAARLRAILASPDVRNADRRIFTGDLFDRDAGSLEVFKMLRSEISKNDVLLWGNHDLYLILAGNGHEEMFAQWLGEGGVQLIENVMDIEFFRAPFLHMTNQMPDASFDEVMDRFRDDKDEIFRRLFEEFKENESVKEICLWLLQRGKLFHVDEYGMLYLHAGIKAAGGLAVDLIDYRSASHLSFVKMLEAGASFQPAMMFHKSHAFIDMLELREPDWLMGFVGDGASTVFERLADLGIRGAVYGHTSGQGVRSAFGRFFNIDMSMAVHYGGYGGFFRIGPEGIFSHRFVDHETDEIAVEGVVGASEFAEVLAEDAPVIIDRFQSHFTRRAAGID